MLGSIIEPTSNLIATFNLKRAIALICIISIITTSAWIIDNYIGYTSLSRIEKTIHLIERVQEIDKAGPLKNDLDSIRNQVVQQLNQNHTVIEFTFNNENRFSNWLRQAWLRFAAGGLPWFSLSLLMLPSIFRKQKDALSGFLVIQFITIFFGVLFLAIPQTGNAIIDLLVLPWTALIIIAGIPISIYAAKEVRNSSITIAITNNLRQIAAAADQYYLENGVNTVSTNELIGPNKYIKTLRRLDGESYENMDLKQGIDISVTRSNGTIVMIPG